MYVLGGETSMDFWVFSSRNLGKWSNLGTGIQPPFEFRQDQPAKNPPRFNPSPRIRHGIHDVCPRKPRGVSGRSSTNHICTMIKSMTFWNPTFRTLGFGSNEQKVLGPNFGCFFAGKMVVIKTWNNDFYETTRIFRILLEEMGIFRWWKIQNLDASKRWELLGGKKTWGYFAHRQTMKEKHRIILRGYFCLKPRQLGFLCAFGKKHRYPCIFVYITYHYIYIYICQVG